MGPPQQLLSIKLFRLAARRSRQVFFPPREAPKSGLEANFHDFWYHLSRCSAQGAFLSASVSKQHQEVSPRSPQNQGFRLDWLQNSRFSDFRIFDTDRQKKNQNEPQGPKMEPKAGSGTPWEGEISLGHFSGALPEDHNELFSAPGGFGNVLGASREDSWSTLGAHLEPKTAPEASRSHFGTTF